MRSIQLHVPAKENNLAAHLVVGVLWYVTPDIRIGIHCNRYLQ